MENQILERLGAIERNSLLAAKSVLTLEEASLYTGLSKAYLYRLTSAKEIPDYRPNGKLCYFDKAELNVWLHRNRVSTKEEAESKAALYNLKKEATV